MNPAAPRASGTNRGREFISGHVGGWTRSRRWRSAESRTLLRRGNLRPLADHLSPEGFDKGNRFPQAFKCDGELAVPLRDVKDDAPRARRRRVVTRTDTPQHFESLVSDHPMRNADGLSAGTLHGIKAVSLRVLYHLHPTPRTETRKAPSARLSHKSVTLYGG